MLRRTSRLLAVAAVAGGACASSDVPFGHQLRDSFFYAPNYTQWNHGAYGGTPRPVIDAQYTYVAQMEADTEAWMNGPNGYRGCILAARAALAAKINANESDLVLVDNATEGLNDVIRNMEPPLGSGDWILDLSTAYGPFTGLYQWMEDRYGVQTLTVPIVFPVTGPESFLDPLRAALQANASTLNIRVAVISHISAYPSLVLPVAELVQLLHSYGIYVIVDGAHVPGNIPLDLSTLGDPDVWFGNLHKWYYAPKSVAMLVVRGDRQLPNVPAPSCIDNPETEAFPDRFIWTGTRDRTCFCAIADAIAFRESLGDDEAVMNYTRSLAAAGGTFLVGNWSTQLLHPLSMASSMVSIQVPTTNNTACQIVAGQLKAQHGFNMPASASLDAAHGGIACYWRLSAQVYQDMSDWERLGGLTEQLLRALGAWTGKA